MKVLFAASPSIAVPCLETLCGELCFDEGIEIAGVLTNPDTAKGRHGTPEPTEIGEAAEKILLHYQQQGRAAFPILKPMKLDAGAREQVEATKSELLVSFAYGRFFGPKFLSLFPLGGINIHPSLLPKYRGPAPVQAAILNRETVTGITFQTLAQEMDSGDILAQEQLQLTGRETTFSLSEVVSQKAAEMLPGVLKSIASGTSHPVPQDHGQKSYCSLLSKEESVIDWKQSAAVIDAKIRAFDPWPLCRTFHNGRELLVLKASVFTGTPAAPAAEKSAGTVLGIDKQNGILISTGEGTLAVTQLQYHTKKALFWRDFLNGARDFEGSILG